MKYHVKGLATADENLRYLLYMIEKGVALAKEASTIMCYMCRDLSDFGNLWSERYGGIGWCVQGKYEEVYAHS